MKRTIYTALVAVLCFALFLIFIAGCGGGGGDLSLVTTKVSGRVVDQNGSPLKGAQVQWTDTTTKTVNTDDNGYFTAIIVSPKGERITIKVTHQSIAGSTSRTIYDLLGKPIILTDDVEFLPHIRQQTFDSNCARARVPIAVTFTVNGQAMLPDEIREVVVQTGPQTNIIFNYSGPFDFNGQNIDLGSYNIGKWYFQAPESMRIEARMLFKNVNGLQGPIEHLMATAIIDFVISRDTLPPHLEIVPLVGTQTGSISIKGTAYDTPKSGSRVYKKLGGADNIDLSQDATRQSEECQIEASPTGVLYVEMSYLDKTNSVQKAQIVPDSQNHFTFNLNTETLNNGLATMQFAAYDRAVPANRTEVKLQFHVLN